MKEEIKIFDIRVVPNSSKTLLVEDEEMLKLKVCAPALDGKANSAVIEFFAKYYKVPKSKVKILKGEKSRNKRVSVEF